jgi:magnesium transporter
MGMTSFELTREYLEDLKLKIENKEEESLRKIFDELHAADIAEIYAELDLNETRYIHPLLDEQTAADVLTELEEEQREEIFSVMPANVIARQYINNMDSDDAADVIAELPDDVQAEILKNIPDIEQAGDIADLLTYDEDTAGGLMAKELIKVNVEWDINTCIKEMRKQGEEVTDVYYVYAVDDYNKLVGTVPLKKMLISPTQTKIKKIVDEDIISVNVMESSKDVAVIMDKYGLVALPVVDGIGRLMGRITIDDVVDAIREETDKDYQLMSGISSDVDSSDNVWNLTKARIPWLLIAMVGGVLGSLVVGRFTGELRLYPELAIFIPMITAMGGNVGIQSSAIIIRGLATDSLGMESTGKKLAKEFGVGAINGIILSGCILGYNLIFTDSYALTLSVSIALLAVIIFASIFGTIVPLALKQLNVDPALATGPFITTVDDIIGVMIYLTMGRLLYTMV